MKRFLLIIPLTLCFLFLFCGCGAKKTDHATGGEEGVFRYGFTDCTAFAVDEEGFLYAAFGEESEVLKYDPSGEEVGSFSIGEGLHSKFWIDGETLYGFTYGDTEIYYSRVEHRGRFFRIEDRPHVPKRDICDTEGHLSIQKNRPRDNH